MTVAERRADRLLNSHCGRVPQAWFALGALDECAACARGLSARAEATHLLWRDCLDPHWAWGVPRFLWADSLAFVRAWIVDLLRESRASASAAEQTAFWGWLAGTEGEGLPLRRAEPFQRMVARGLGGVPNLPEAASGPLPPAPPPPGASELIAMRCDEVLAMATHPAIWSTTTLAARRMDVVLLGRAHAQARYCSGAVDTAARHRLMESLLRYSTHQSGSVLEAAATGIVARQLAHEADAGLLLSELAARVDCWDDQSARRTVLAAVTLTRSLLDSLAAPDADSSRTATRTALAEHYEALRRRSPPWGRAAEGVAFLL
jgi:hypothetical protein